MVTRRQNSASSVVGLIFIMDMTDRKLIMPATKTRGHCTSAHAYPPTKKKIHAPSRLGGKMSTKKTF